MSSDPHERPDWPNRSRPPSPPWDSPDADPIADLRAAWAKEAADWESQRRAEELTLLAVEDRTTRAHRYEP